MLGGNRGANTTWEDVASQADTQYMHKARCVCPTAKKVSPTLHAWSENHQYLLFLGCNAPLSGFPSAATYFKCLVALVACMYVRICE